MLTGKTERKQVHIQTFLQRKLISNAFAQQCHVKLIQVNDKLVFSNMACFPLHRRAQVLSRLLRILFIYFWLCWVFVAARGLSLVAASGVSSSLRCAGFSLRWLLLLWSMGSRHTGFSSCRTQVQQLWLAGSRAQAQYLWHTGLVALWHVGSSRTRARTRVPCIGRRILNHCTTREAPKLLKIN